MIQSSISTGRPSKMSRLMEILSALVRRNLRQHWGFAEGAHLLRRARRLHAKNRLRRQIDQRQGPCNHQDITGQTEPLDEVCASKNSSERACQYPFVTTSASCRTPIGNRFANTIQASPRLSDQKEKPIKRSLQSSARR